MRRSARRLATLLVSLPLLLCLFAALYQVGMAQLEGQTRSFVQGIEWAAETLTTTGYGHDDTWTHPVMVGYVIFVQVVGVLLVFMVIPVFLIPYFEERFDVRLPTRFPDLDGHVVIYRYGPEVATLVEELERAKVPVVIFEEDEPTARRLFDRQRSVVFGDLAADDPDLSRLRRARAVVGNGDDDDNAVLTMNARQIGFDGPIIALVDKPSLRAPMTRAGATAVLTPSHVVAAAIAAKASTRISPRVSGAQRLGDRLDIAEVRVHDGSGLAGASLADADVRRHTGATIIGRWVDGEIVLPTPEDILATGDILIAAGSTEAIERLGGMARAVRRSGAIVVVGHGAIARKVIEFLRLAGEEVVVVAGGADDGVDVTGDVYDPEVLERAGVADAQTVVLALDDDSATLFVAAVVRGLAADVPVVASVGNAAQAGRIHLAGADFTLSVGQVAGQLLAFQLLGEESVSLEAGLKVARVAAGSLAGQPLQGTRIRERTGCSIVAVEHGEEIVVDVGRDFVIREGDALYVSGTPEMIARYYDIFADEAAVTSGPRSRPT